jgi:hypothetical protein
LNNDDHLDIICGNWEGIHRIFLQLKAKSVRHFRNVASTFFEHPSPIWTVIVADFDNDIQTDIFMNNILRNNDSQSNSLFGVNIFGNINKSLTCEALPNSPPSRLEEDGSVFNQLQYRGLMRAV